MDKIYTTEEETAELFESLVNDDAPEEPQEATEEPETESEVDDTQDDDDSSDDAPEEADDSSDDDPDDDDELLEWKGKKYSQKEIQEFINGGLRQDDYTKKTQKLADERKEWEAKKEKEWQDMQKLVEQAKNTDSFNGTDDELAQMALDDPYRYNEIRAQKDAQEQIFLKQAEIATQKLMEISPEFRDNFDSEYKSTLEYMVEQGMPQDEAVRVIDPVVIKAFRDAKSNSANNGLASKKVKVVPKNTGSTNPDSTRSANKAKKEMLSKARTTDDLANIFEMME